MKRRDFIRAGLSGIGAALFGGVPVLLAGEAPLVRVGRDPRSHFTGHNTTMTLTSADGQTYTFEFEPGDFTFAPAKSVVESVQVGIADFISSRKPW